MSDPYVVLVTVDFSPHDSDQDTVPAYYEFSGPDQAQAFYDKAVEIALATTTDVAIISIYEPLSVTRMNNAEEALEALKEWIGENE